MAVTNKGVLVFVWGTLAAVVLALVVSAIVLRPKASLPVLGQMSEFTLLNQNGKTNHLNDLRGKIWIADVIFTRCASQCPLMSTHLAAIQTSIPTNKPIRFVSFTTDPAFDTPPVLKKYAAHYNADPSRWFFLTGDKPTLKSTIVDGLKLPSIDKAPSERENDVDLFVHSAKFVLIDGFGRIRGYYDGETDASIPQVVEAAEQLAKEL